MAAIQHAVWPTGAPDVTPARWEQEDWMRFEDGYRPKDYEGGRYDAEAWKAYCERNHARNLRAFQARHGLFLP